MRLSRESVRFLTPGLVDYEAALTLQQQLAASRSAGDGPDSVILLEHPSVYTAGKRTEPEDRPTNGAGVIDVDRGGKITWHGPGQLVGYPIVLLADRARIVDYVDMLEQVLIDACAEVGVVAGRVAGRSGVWLPAAPDGRPERKIAAIGIRVTGGITGHGFALNCECDLAAFDAIVPCGIRDAGVTSLSVETGRTVSVSQMLPIVTRLLAIGLNGTLPHTDVDLPHPAPEGSAPMDISTPRTTPAATPSATPTTEQPGRPRRLLRVEARNAQVPVERKPEWMRTKLRTGPEFKKMQALVNHEQVFTVCQEAKCPNIYECWEDREASFLIGGDTCTRRCDFCNIKTGRPGTFDADEPRRIGESVAKMQLKYATVTGVTRDDLLDEGAWLYAETVRQIHAQSPGTGVEILTPDFSGKADLLQQVFDTSPAVFAHNIETVPRIFKRIRPGFSYDGSLAVLTLAKSAGMVTKSNLILGMGETREEITQALEDLRGAGCDLLTVTQYLRPSPTHHPIDRFVKPREFVDIRKEALFLGFVGVMSGPLVRSSYKAGSLYRQAIGAAETASAAVGSTVHAGGPGIATTP